MRRYKKRTDEEHINETWLIPYADMLTLLLALFIILYASSTLDAQKLERIIQTFTTAFQGGQPVLQSPAVTPDEITEGTNDEQDEEESPQEEPGSGFREREMEELRRLQERINTYIKQRNLQLSLKTELTEAGLIITILDHALFDSGSAVVKPDAVKLAREISNLLVSDPPRHIEISGHTDNVPIHNSHFRSNWDLSAMRAINFLKIILENENLSPEYFSVRGYGEYKPVATNDTAEGRQQNRRVEVLILPNY
ncbi:OmpA/MotB domain protein [Caldalkalibacillus thermarum TA2.A1]|uniref:OmpA/MotB domain protein n=1 Tax=Caldalkalibacillus thermarum (strain TA2.A1) TaxID=986075 RepID=F5L6V5_CALTT|nr:flagellar motor protein MotB [Caldalkalibacillus thermarum]EGL82941.1 OmpA/MotB domain protein [Caldalkalibacillus thermarum TA2.A1]